MLDNFGAPVEQSENFTPKVVMTGKSLYTVVAVNPDNAKLKELGQYTTQEEPSYVGEREDDGQKYPLARITVLLKRVNEDETAEPVIDRVTYDLTNRVKVSKNTGKLPIINEYGQENWATPEEVAAGTVPTNIAAWYFSEGLKAPLDGEANLIKFIRALFNFKAVNVKSETLADDKSKFKSLLRKSDLDKLFAGDFNDIRTLLTRKGPEDKALEVGFLLGAKSADNGKIYQDMFREFPLRKYQVSKDANEYLIKEVSESQAAGKYPNTTFVLTGKLELKEFNSASAPKADPKNDGSSMESPASFTEEEHDDLPF